MRASRIRIFTVCFTALGMVFTLGCGRFFLSDEVSRSPAVAAADGFGPAPSTATVWVEIVEPGFVAVVGKVFDEPDSATADAAPLKTLSPLIATPVVGGLPHFSGPINGLDVVRIDGGFFVVWQLRGDGLSTGGGTWGLFTDLGLNPSGSPIQLSASLPPPSTNPRRELWVFYVAHRDRVVVFTHGESLQLAYIIIDSQTRQLLNEFKLPDETVWEDVSYDRNPNRRPFMVTYLSPEGQTINDPFRIRAAFLDFDAPAESLFVMCRADLSETSTPDFNNTAGATHPWGFRYAVWDKRNGDIFGAFVEDDCRASPEFFLGTRAIARAPGAQMPRRNFFPMDVRFDSSGNGLIAMHQAIPSNLTLDGITYVVSVMPLRFDGFIIYGGAVRPVGLPQRRGVPYLDYTFQLRSDFEAFKLVFDEVAISEDRLPVPGTWRVLFNALDANGNTI